MRTNPFQHISRGKCIGLNLQPCKQSLNSSRGEWARAVPCVGKEGWGKYAEVSWLVQNSTGKSSFSSSGALMYFSIESQNHRMVCFGRDVKDHLVSPPQPLAGTPPTRPSCSKPHPPWAWTLPATGHSQLLWATCSSVSPPP